MDPRLDITTWRVLIVDDEPDNLLLASELLEFSGATVARTRTGRDLLDMIDDFRPNLILLDLAMPGMDGWEVHQRLRERPDLNDVPVVALTALAMPEDADRVKAAGFNGYVTKPFRISSLLDNLIQCVKTFVPAGAKDKLIDAQDESKHD